MNISIDFSQSLETKSKQRLPYQLDWKKTRTQTKFRKKKSNFYKFIRDIAESNFTMTSH